MSLTKEETDRQWASVQSYQTYYQYGSIFFAVVFLGMLMMVTSLKQLRIKFNPRIKLNTKNREMIICWYNASKEKVPDGITGLSLIFEVGGDV